MSTNTIQKTWISPDRLDDRMDAKPFQRAILDCIDKTLNCGYPIEKLGDDAVTTFINRGVNGAVDNQTSTKLLKTRHVRAGYTEFETAYLPDDKSARLGSKKLRKGDVLLTSTGLGTIGRASLYISNDKATVDNHVTIIRTNPNQLSEGLLTAFLNSKYGIALSNFGTTGSTGQLELSKGKISSFKVPLPPQGLQKYVGDKCKLATVVRIEGEKSLTQAIKMFNDILSVGDIDFATSQYSWTKGENIFDRITSQFYLPRYFDLEEHLRGLGHAIVRMSKMLRRSPIRTSTPERDSSAKIPCLLTSDIDPQDIRINQPSLWVTESTHSRHAGKLEEYDVIYSSVGPPVGEAAIVLPEYLPACVGGDVSVIRTNGDAHPGFVCLYLNSIFGQMQNDRYSRGIRQRRVYPSDIENFLIPKIDDKDQAAIGGLVIKYQRLKDASSKLIDKAVSDAEKLIEGELDTDAIMSGKLKAPTWEDIEKELEGI